MAHRGDVIALAQNVLSIRHWDRLLGGVLYASSPRIDWARLLRRSLGVDALKCPKCDGRLRVLAVITENESVRAFLRTLDIRSTLRRSHERGTRPTTPKTPIGRTSLDSASHELTGVGRRAMGRARGSRCV
jgi:hypothetical protein